MLTKLKRLNSIVRILLLLEILTSVYLVIITAYYHSVLVVYLAKSERQMLVGQLSSIYLLGLELLVCYLAGLILWRMIWRGGKILENKKLLAAWSGFCLLTIGSGSATAWFLYSGLEALKDAAATSLYQGIDMYFSNPEWKLLWDGIQYQNECCGVTCLEDWNGASWMPHEFTDCLPENQTRASILIPYACCKRSKTSCFQNYAPKPSAATTIYLDPSDVNTKGCLDGFKLLANELFSALTTVMFVVIVLEIMLLAIQLMIISKVKRLCFAADRCPEDGDELPLVVVKYPRNVRCMTLTDDDSFDDEEGVSFEQETMENERDNRFCH